MTLMSSLVDAAETLIRRHQEHRHQHQQSTTSTNVVVDVIGIVNNIAKTSNYDVLSISRNKRIRSRKKSKQQQLQRVDLWLTDAHGHTTNKGQGRSSSSTPAATSTVNSTAAGNTGNFHVVLYGSSEIKRIEQEQIRKGSILRLNDLCLMTTTTTTSFKLSPFSGMGWFCFGNLNDNGIDEVLSRTTDRNDDLDTLDDKPVPVNMITPKDRIVRLVESWRKSTSQHRCHSIRSGGNEDSYDSTPPRNESGIDTTVTRVATSHDIGNYREDLEALPCRKRRISEIQSLGMISTIQAYVTDLRCYDDGDDGGGGGGEIDDLTEETELNYQRNKKKRKSSTTGTIIFASVTDELSLCTSGGTTLAAAAAAANGSTMTFIDTTGKFKTILKQAALEGDHHTDNVARKQLILTNVRTKNSNSLRGLPSSTEDLVLVPTNDTTASLLEIDGNNKHNNVGRDEGIGSSSYAVANERFVDASQRRRDIDKDMNILQSQQNDDAGQTNCDDGNASALVVISCLDDIHVGGKSLKKDNFSALKSISKFRRTVFENDEYRSDCILTLSTFTNNYSDRSNYSKNSHVRKEQERQILAEPTVLRTLCGRLDAEELLEDDELCNIALDLIRSMIETRSDSSKVKLEWTVQKHLKNQQMLAVKVALPETC